MTSFLHDNGKKIGLIAVISDLTEIAEMEYRHIQEIGTLLDSLVRTFSVAIDERSHYTGRHTQNMVGMATTFLNWLRETENPLQFSSEEQKAFLMSVWLHDIGKIAIPLEIMDKATRLGPMLEVIEERFERIKLLDRIALLEGRITHAEYTLEVRKKRGYSFLCKTDKHQRLY